MTQTDPKLPQAGISREESQPAKVIDDALHSRKGSREPLAELLNQLPELAAVGGSMAAKAEKIILEVATGGNVFATETTKRQLRAMRQELARPGDGELGNLLVERVVVCWLSLYSAERYRANVWRTSMGTKEAAFWDRHVSRLHSDFLKGCKSLALVRRLLCPVVAQVNIAGQQVNVVEPGAGIG